jgi:hypothetical protein
VDRRTSGLVLVVRSVAPLDESANQLFEELGVALIEEGVQAERESRLIAIWLNPIPVGGDHFAHLVE